MNVSAFAKKLASENICTDGIAWGDDGDICFSENVSEDIKRKVIAIRDSWNANDEHNENINAQIVALEKTVTPRRIREAVCGSDKSWLENLDNQIAVLRSKLI